MKSWTICFYLILILIAPVAWAGEKDPDCTGSESWPTMMAMTHLKNANIIDHDKHELDYSKTKVTRLASQKIGKSPYSGMVLYRQVHHIIFMELSGNAVEVVTVNDASNSECSEGGVEVFVVSKHLNQERK